MYEQLLAEEKTEPVERKVEDFSPAERDLKSASTMLKSGQYDWALSIAYNSALKQDEQ